MANQVRARREELGITQSELAMRVRVTRQSLSAIEAGRVNPSVTLALALCRVLQSTVEELFGISAGEGSIEASWAIDRKELGAEQRVWLAKEDSRWLAYPVSGSSPGADSHAADGIITGYRGRRLLIEALRDPASLESSLVIAGCAGALGILAERVGSAQSLVRWFPATSLDALSLFEQRRVHLVGLHLVDEQTGESNLPFLQQRDFVTGAQLFHLISWEQGYILQQGNPLGFRDAADLARPSLRILGRQPGAAARMLLEREFQRAQVPLRHLPEVASHEEVARLISLGLADVGVGTRTAAESYKLDFIPLQEECFDLLVDSSFMEDVRVQHLLDTLASRILRRELGAVRGYGVEKTGEHVASFPATGSSVA